MKKITLIVFACFIAGCSNGRNTDDEYLCGSPANFIVNQMIEMEKLNSLKN